MTSIRIPSGTKVTWTSEAQGIAKTKTGYIVAFLPKKKDNGTYAFPLSMINDLRAICDQAFSVYGLGGSSVDRYLVKVPRVSKKGDQLKPKWYTPYANLIERQNQP